MTDEVPMQTTVDGREVPHDEVVRQTAAARRQDAKNAASHAERNTPVETRVVGPDEDTAERRALGFRDRL